MPPELGHTSVDCVGRYTNLVGCILTRLAVSQGAPWLASSSLRKPSLQALTLLRGARFITWCLRSLFLEESQQGPRHFCSHQTCLGNSPAPGPTKKEALFHTHPICGTYNKYQLNAALLLRKSILYRSTRWLPKFQHSPTKCDINNHVSQITELYNHK